MLDKSGCPYTLLLSAGFAIVCFFVSFLGSGCRLVVADSKAVQKYATLACAPPVFLGS